MKKMVEWFFVMSAISLACSLAYFISRREKRELAIKMLQASWTSLLRIKNLYVLLVMVGVLVFNKMPREIFNNFYTIILIIIKRESSCVCVCVWKIKLTFIYFWLESSSFVGSGVTRPDHRHNARLLFTDFAFSPPYFFWLCALSLWLLFWWWERSPLV